MEILPGTGRGTARRVVEGAHVAEALRRRRGGPPPSPLRGATSPFRGGFSLVCSSHAATMPSNSSHILQHIDSGNAQHAKAALFQNFVTQLVLEWPVPAIVRETIHLDPQSRREAGEVQRIRLGAETPDET